MRAFYVVASLGFLAPLSQAAVLFNFESGLQGWTNDTSQYYRNNFPTAPALSAARSHAGASSLAAALDFADRESYGINDALLINPAEPLDLAAAAGVTLYVYLQSGAGNGNPIYPLLAHVFIKTGPGYTGFKGGDVQLSPGQWTKVQIVFENAFLYDATGAPASVTGRGDVREIGLHVFGALYDRGTAVLFMDTVESGLGDDATPPAAPAALNAANAGSGNRVDLSWAASAEADRYEIYRGDVSGPFAGKRFLKSVPDLSAADFAVVDGLTYFYQVVAVDKSGNRGAPSAETSATPSGAAGYGAPMKGMTFVTWDADALASYDAQGSLDDLKATGAGMVAVVVTQYMENGADQSIAPGPKTPTDASLISAISGIHARGMQVMLKPHVDLDNGVWRGAIFPNNLDSWFASYRAFITHYAQIAQAHGVELFCVGTELKSMTDVVYDLPQNPDRRLNHWTTVINSVKAIYSGPLTYAANASYGIDEFAQVQFWDQLTYVGLDAYFPLTNSNTPDLADLKRAWSFNKDGQNPLRIVEEWRNYTGKDIIFTEIGYRSADGANTAPHDFQVAAAVDMEEQNATYQAALSAWNRQPYFKGLFWWHWDPYLNNGGGASTYYIPQDKPAQDTLTVTYGGEEVRGFYDFESGLQGWTADHSADFQVALGTPVVSSQDGTQVLDFPLNLNNHGGGNEVSDWALVDRAVPIDLSGYTGLKARVKIPAGAVPDTANPLKVALMVQTGNDYKWYQSNVFRTLTPGRWREISMDFASAQSFAPGNLGQGKPVLDLGNVRRIGLLLSGAASSAGNTRFYVDNVAGRGSGTILGLSISTSAYSFGSLDALGRAITVSSIDLENSGNVAMRYVLNCSSSVPASWGPAAVPQAGRFVLNAQFNSTRPEEFVEANQALYLTPAPSTDVKFAGDQEGSDVPPSGLRNLWLELQTPPVVSVQDMAPQAIGLGITAEIE